jgi:hypothetical protein
LKVGRSSQNQATENKAAWLIWEKLRKSKRDGGLGFSDLYDFNLAMLARQAWRMPALESSCAVLKAKTLPKQFHFECPTDGRDVLLTAQHPKRSCTA